MLISWKQKNTTTTAQQIYVKIKRILKKTTKEREREKERE